MYDQQISLLNSLIEINHDRIEGYHKAASLTKDFDLQQLFNLYSKQSSTFTKELGEYVLAMDGQINLHDCTSGKMYRIWMDIRSVFDGKDRKGLLECCAFAEKNALRVYDIFLEDDDSGAFPIDCIAIIQDQRSKLSFCYDELKALAERDLAQESK